MRKSIFLLAAFCLLCSKAAFANNDRPAELRAIVKFELDSGRIIVPVRLNDSQRTLRFLFDTGADGMAIRQSLADSLNLPESHSQSANIVGGTAKISISRGNSVHIGDTLTLPEQSIALFPEISGDLDGILGLNPAYRYITEVNFDRQEIRLYSFGKFQYPENGEFITMKDSTNIILIPATLNIVGKKDAEGFFVFDTGASYHLIGFSRFVRKNRLLLTGFKPESEASTVSMGHATPVFNGKAFQFRLNRFTFDQMPVTLQASSSRNDSADTPDGSIGIFIINRFNFVIDKKQRTVFLSPRE
ncbi:MAG: retroviral-like aspartic protease family protein [Dysgonamonadaceae bacterium]|jgi:predicted aspartyl protease|nr:retroviral-like aspartic protease family protein [Dysgonamonadaceae bacterium]